LYLYRCKPKIYNYILCDFNRCDFQHKEPGRDKHKISCPFLRRNSFCLKGDRCDYSHIGFSHGMVAPRPRMNATAYPSSSLHTPIYQCAPPFQPKSRHNIRSPFLSHSPWPMIPPCPPPPLMNGLTWPPLTY
jgi:hypothetical protein